jgi:Icc-related predicted phosphoesterase
MTPSSASEPPAAGLVDGEATLARLDVPTARTPTRLAVAGDHHLSPTGAGGWKALHRSEQRLRAALSTADRADADGVLLLGDLTRRGQPREFAVLDELLADFDLGVPAVAVPGNHDVPRPGDDPTPPVSRFADRYGPGSYPRRVDVGGVSVVCLDTASDAAGRDAEGAVSPGTLDWLEETLPSEASPVVAMHHNLFPPRRHSHHFAQGDEASVENGATLESVLRRGGAGLMLSGHLHWPATTDRDGLRELVAPATCSFPPAMLLLDVTPWGTTVRLVPLAGQRGMIEAYDLACEGSDHSRTLAAQADAGYFDGLPLVDERTSPARVGGDVPRSLRWR